MGCEMDDSQVMDDFEVLRHLVHSCEQQGVFRSIPIDEEHTVVA